MLCTALGGDRLVADIDIGDLFFNMRMSEALFVVYNSNYREELR